MKIGTPGVYFWGCAFSLDTGVSVNAYKLLKDNVTPFRCFCCHQLQNNEKVSLLTDTVQELRDEIALLKKSLCTMQSSVEQLPQVAQVRVTTDQSQLWIVELSVVSQVGYIHICNLE